MAYIGKQPIVGNFQICDAISVVNGQAAYTMQVASTNVNPESANHMLVSLNGVLQKPGSSFTISGSTITFASNLATGDVIDFIILLGDALNLGTPSDGTVTTAKLAADAVTEAKIADDAVESEHLNNNIISGQTALGAEPADTDEFLVSDAGTIKRVDYSYIKGGSGMVKLQSQTASSASSISFTSTYITSTYKVYELHCIDVLHSSDGGNIALVVSADNGSSYVETGYKAMRHYSNETNGNNTLLSSANTGNSSISILGSGEGLGTSGNESGNSIITLFNPQGAKSKFFRCNGLQHNTSNQLSMQHFWFSLDQSATYNNIKIIPNTGTFSGTFILYGVTA